MPSFRVPVLGFAVSFLSLFPASLPQPFHRCLPSACASGIFPLPARFLSSACLPLPATQPSVLPFQLFPVSPHSGFFRCPFPLSLPRFPPSLRPDFSCLPSGFLYSALLMVSFRPSLIRSRSCSSGASLMLSLSGFPHPIRFLSSASLPVPATQPLFLPFLSFSSPLRFTAAFRVPPFGLSASGLFRFRSARFPVLRFRFQVLGFLSVSFHPSRFRSHSRSTGASLMLSLSGFPRAQSFLSSAFARF